MVSPKLRNSIFARDEYRCVACGASSQLTIQHRVNKGMGGSKKVETPAHLLTLCFECNTSLESNSEWAEKGRELGYKLPKNFSPPIDPKLIPVWYYLDKKWFLLDNEMNRKEIKTWQMKPL